VGHFWKSANTIESDRARVKVRFATVAPPATPKAARTLPIATASNACRDCGAKLAIRKRVYCDDCYPDRIPASRLAFNAAFRSAGRERLKAMRALASILATIRRRSVAVPRRLQSNAERRL
jgi:hypothetical protein